MATDAEYRKEAAARPVRSQTKYLTDGDLLAKLHTFGIDLDRSSLESLCKGYLSAEEIARPFVQQRIAATKQDDLESDWIWICLDALWQRWFPDRPSFEMLDDKIQEGYELIECRHVTAACRIWLEAWANVVQILDIAGIKSISEFDDRFRGTQCVFNWIQDFEIELWNAGLRDRKFLTARIAICEERLRRFAAEDNLMTQNCRHALAESYFERGDTAKADTLYREWLSIDPQWGRGWIGWSDCYQSTRTEFRNLHKAEELLRKGLAIAGVRDFQDLNERLANLYQEQGRVDEVKEIQQQKKKLNTPGIYLVPSAPPQVIAKRDKIGRNEPCPCGSGKKFKKCCAGELPRS